MHHFLAGVLEDERIGNLVSGTLFSEISRFCRFFHPGCIWSACLIPQSASSYFYPFPFSVWIAACFSGNESIYGITFCEFIHILHTSILPLPSSIVPSHHFHLTTSILLFSMRPRKDSQTQIQSQEILGLKTQKWDPQDYK